MNKQPFISNDTDDNCSCQSQVLVDYPLQDRSAFVASGISLSISAVSLLPPTRDDLFWTKGLPAPILACVHPGEHITTSKARWHPPISTACSTSSLFLLPPIRKEMVNRLTLESYQISNSSRSGQAKIAVPRTLINPKPEHKLPKHQTIWRQAVLLRPDMTMQLVWCRHGTTHQ